MEGGPGLKPVENETTSCATRTTKEGKKYTYRLTVVQQPSRARACGAGAKSSADRRPVDPPPIVELKIYDDSDSVRKDVTFCMNANYFLFATLEQARNMAPGRMNQQDQKGLTVLTGTPVAGMVCLDRPEPAGYFIFPDLSVRHEGKYRLSFSLYEELREAKDEDQGEDTAKSSDPNGSHVTHRLEVKSAPFIVYSAKKFPGLTESTSLSRTVAEQGCRVRIRRDVRMRKRESKNGKDWENYEDETAEARARATATPEGSVYGGVITPRGFGDAVSRPRSGSNASLHSLAPSLPVSRRPSQQEIAQSYHAAAAAYGAPPQTPQSGYPHTSPYGPSPNQAHPQGQFMQQQSTMQPPLPQYQQQFYQPAPPMNQPPQPQQGYYNYSSAPPPPPMSYNQYAPPPPPPAYEPQNHHRMSVDYSQPQYTHQRSSSQFTAPPPPPQATQPTYSHTQPSYQPPPAPQHQPTYPTQTSDPYAHRPPPLEPIQPPTRTTGANQPQSARPLFDGKKLPSINTLNMPSTNKLEPASPLSAAPHSAHPNLPTNSVAAAAPDSHKRGYGQVFRESHLSQPLRFGARPSTPGQNSHSYYSGATEVDDGDSAPTGFEEMQRLGAGACSVYRRANGRPAHRFLQQEED